MIALGNTEITKAYLGSTEISKMYIGSTLVFDSNGSTPTPTLPYDSEIEYIEGTGTQWIDTGVSFAVGTIVEFTAQVTQNYTTTQIVIGFSDDGGCWCGNVKTSKWGVNGTGLSGSNSSVKSDLTLTYSTRTSLTNGVNTNTQGRSKTPTTTLTIFTRTSFVSYAKIYSVKVTQNSVLVRDFIPVRVGQVGYMYDKVSGTLFGNSGSGNFTLGSDVTT